MNGYTDHRNPTVHTPTTPLVGFNYEKVPTTSRGSFIRLKAKECYKKRRGVEINIDIDIEDVCEIIQVLPVENLSDIKKLQKTLLNKEIKLLEKSEKDTNGDSI